MARTKLYHAHDGGSAECIIPPYDGWACPYGTKEAADAARPHFPKFAILFASLELTDMTSSEFAYGKDKDARRVLEMAFRQLAGHGIQDDPFTAAHDENCTASCHIDAVGHVHES